MNVWEEGWPWVDKIKHNCEPPGDDGIYFPSRPMPVLFHYCQGYRVRASVAGGDDRIERLCVCVCVCVCVCIYVCVWHMQQGGM